MSLPEFDFLSIEPLVPDYPYLVFRTNYRLARVIRMSLKVLIRNATRNTVLAAQAEVADTSARRRTGLLKHQNLPKGEGLWIVPCEAVHSFFMKFPIDVIYLDRGKRVRKVTRGLVPWRISGCLTAHSVLELPAGMAEETQTQPGDQLVFENV